jgi:hypothetical protein
LHFCPAFSALEMRWGGMGAERKRAMLPTWVIQIGSLAGLGMFAFTLVDRFFSGRPIVSIRPAGVDTRDFYCLNPSKHDILIRKVWLYPAWVGLTKGNSVTDIVEFACACRSYH